MERNEQYQTTSVTARHTRVINIAHLQLGAIREHLKLVNIIIAMVTKGGCKLEPSSVRYRQEHRRENLRCENSGCLLQGIKQPDKTVKGRIN
jgi:hypothetical protein